LELLYTYLSDKSYLIEDLQPSMLNDSILMISIQENKPLKSLNTFGLMANATSFAEITATEDIFKLSNSPEFQDKPWLVLGGGSNILLTTDSVPTVVKISIPGIEITSEDETSVFINVGAGVVWHDLVMWTLQNGFYGLENLSLIPGQVGAAPIQNIGAYGVELTDVFQSLELVHLHDGQKHTFLHDECDFGYRSSVFKKELKGRIIITNVVFKLHKKPKLMLDYGDIRQVLQERNITSPTPSDVSNAVIFIRQSKLPDPAVIGNAGSFFKNPEVDAEFYTSLKNEFPAMPGYTLPDGRVKIPAGWLIDQLGWKGKRFGDAGVHSRQALVLVNHGNASGHEILSLAKQVQESVLNEYNIGLEPEVNVI
jgi:UDP-N-acetylmuramate dehydrogenase